MPLPTGQISMSEVNTELGISSTATITLNDAAVRSLAGVPSGAISMQNLQGKASAFSTTITTSQSNLNLLTYVQGLGYSSGAVTVTVGSSVYIWSSGTGTPALTISGFSSSVSLINNGFIMGAGGAGGFTPSPAAAIGNGSAGGPAMSLGNNISLTNNSFIGGGGGGGGSGITTTIYANGGGGAGGGGGGWSTGVNPASGGAIGASGGNAPAAGNGGGGGRIMPGNPAAGQGIGGQAGGSGHSRSAAQRLPPGSVVTRASAGGGGGGWGAAGGSGQYSGSGTGTSNNPGTGGGGGSAGTGGSVNAVVATASGGAGGKAVNLNGFTITYVTTGTIYGTVS